MHNKYINITNFESNHEPPYSKWGLETRAGYFIHHLVRQTGREVFKISQYSREMPTPSTSIPKFETQHLDQAIFLCSAPIYDSRPYSMSGSPQFLTTAQESVRQWLGRCDRDVVRPDCFIYYICLVSSVKAESHILVCFDTGGKKIKNHRVFQKHWAIRWVLLPPC